MTRITEGLLQTLACVAVAGLLIALPGGQATPLRRTKQEETIKETEKHRTKREDDGDAGSLHARGISFLQNFGYFPKSDLETGALRSEEEFKKAVRAMQKIANIPQTGELDEATVEKMNSPRCGLPDTIDETNEDGWSKKRRKKRYNHSSEKWRKNHLTYRFLNYSPKLSRYTIEDAIDKAFRVWSGVTNLDFSKIDTADHADIYLLFGRHFHNDGYPFDGQGMVLAHAFFPGTDDRAGDTHFDADEPWTVGSKNGINLFSVAAHEFGHALGLAHSGVVGSLMYPWYQGFVENFQLHPDDIQGIQTLYGVRYNNNLPPRRPEIPVIPSTTAMVPRRPPTTRTTTTTTTTRRPYTYRPRPRTRRPYVPRTTPKPDGKPDNCNVVIEAADVVRGELMLFSGKWFWRRNEEGILNGYPVLISEFWVGYPQDQHVDAIYERRDGKIVIFYGAHYWLFDGNQLERNFDPKGNPLTDYGLPTGLSKIDAIWRWGHNERIYMISGNMYWKLSHRNKVERNYPRDLSVWGGVPVSPDAAFQFWDGRTYFFKGKQYWEFNDGVMRTRKSSPRPLAGLWMGCSDLPTTETSNEIPIFPAGDEQPRVHGSGQTDNNSNSANGVQKCCGMKQYYVLLLSAFVYLFTRNNQNFS
ncbi:unnamed protein product [Owenia fusiformis]|uniref:Uncharacterized protein n=1 Tax=Owenia fusiformis TaxID=6347 RepID=A0A8J1TNB7_OWEFU|nr:unnamed protein product [Owenia fusiformis]